MGFDSLRVAELREAIEYYGVEVPEDAKKADLIAALASDGVEWEQYKRDFLDDKGESSESDDNDSSVAQSDGEIVSDDKVLVWMTGKNATYETYGYRFTREHPFLAVPRKDADKILSDSDRFRVATPQQVEEYYS